MSHSQCVTSTVLFCLYVHHYHRDPHSFPTRRSSDLCASRMMLTENLRPLKPRISSASRSRSRSRPPSSLICSGSSSTTTRSEEHTSELQSLRHLVCRLLLEKKNKISY